MSVRLRPNSRTRKPGGADRRRRHRHSEGEAEARVAAFGTAFSASAPEPELDIEDYLYGEWGAFLADEAGARAGC
jgi:hypothetical protein